MSLAASDSTSPHLAGSSGVATPSTIHRDSPETIQVHRFSFLIEWMRCPSRHRTLGWQIPPSFLLVTPYPCRLQGYKSVVVFLHEPRPTRTLSTCCQRCPMRNWQNCTFLHSVQSSVLIQEPAASVGLKVESSFKGGPSIELQGTVTPCTRRWNVSWRTPCLSPTSSRPQRVISTSALWTR